MKLTIDQYSQHFKMSKEMIRSKLRLKQLDFIEENNTVFIIVEQSLLTANNDIKDESKQTVSNSQNRQIAVPIKPKTTVAMVLSLYQKENQLLKDKVAQLELKIDKLINDKEQMLRDEINKIERVYSLKDEQLKNIIELINAKLISEQTQTVYEVETIDEVKTTVKKEELVELKSYLKTLDLRAYQRKIIRKRFLAVYDKDIRIIKQNGNIYLNFSKYDYSDLLEY